jgi:hypothetical protein
MMQSSLQQVPDLVVHEAGNDRCTQTEALAQAARHIVFAATFPDAKAACCTHAAIARVESQHDFPQGDNVRSMISPRETMS